MGAYRLSVPVTFSGSGVRDIPEESRRVETWGGYLCGDADTVVAINVKPVSFRSYKDTVQHVDGCSWTRESAPASRAPSDARRGFRIDGLTEGDSPAEPRYLTLVVAETRTGILTLTVRTWPRDDVRQEVDRIVASFRLVRAGVTSRPDERVRSTCVRYCTHAMPSGPPPGAIVAVTLKVFRSTTATWSSPVTAT